MTLGRFRRSLDPGRERRNRMRSGRRCRKPRQHRRQQGKLRIQRENDELASGSSVNPPRFLAGDPGRPPRELSPREINEAESANRMRIVVVGGFGNFGARICRRLSLESSVEIVATGRHPGAASRRNRDRYCTRATRSAWHGDDGLKRRSGAGDLRHLRRGSPSPPAGHRS
jgi:hypothetical protein